MLQAKNNKMKGYTSEIFGIVIMLFIGVFVIAAVITNYVDVKSLYKESSNWFLAKDIDYRVVKCSSSDFGIISPEKINDAKGCVDVDVKYKFSVKDLDTGEQWQDSNEGKASGDVKEHRLFVSIKRPDGTIDRGVVYVTLY